MASPFSVFRKRQKFLMAALCLMAIVAFVFLPILGEFLGVRSHGAANKVVVSSKYGNLRESEVDAMRREHQRILSVLAEVKQMSNVHPAMARQFAEYVFGQATEKSAVDNWMLAQYAKRLGMEVSDKAVVDFMQRWTRNTVKAKDFQDAFKRSGTTERQFIQSLREELLARQLRDMFYASLEGLTPAERWDYFSRIKQMATIEAVAVPVSDYVKADSEPNDAELKAFFDQSKDEYPTPDSAKPGFREPQMVALQWFKADQDKFLAQVTDEEVKQRYEKNKELYDQAEKPVEPPKEPAKDSKPAAKDAQPAKEAKPTGAAEKKAEPVEPAKETKAPEAKDAKQPAKEPAKEPAKKSDATRRSPFMLTSMLQDKKPEEKAAPAAQPAAPATQPAQPEKKPEAAKPAEKKPETAKPAEKKPEATKSGMSEATKARIRREIADEKILKTFDGLRQKMDQFRTEWNKYEVATIQHRTKKGSADTAPTPPAKMDFDKLAKDAGLTTGQSDLAPRWELQSSEIGASLVGGRAPVATYAFQSMSKYRPEMSVDMQGNLYLLWKTNETKDRIPKFDDPGVREKVLKTWQAIQARTPAMEAADKLAGEARKAKKTLKAFAEEKNLHAVLPSPFSWMTFGNVPRGSAPNAVRLSQVDGIDVAGEDFMRTVFRLQPGEIGVAFNGPKTIAYVVQLTKFTPSEEVLWKEFEVDDFSKYAPAAMQDQQKLMRDWLKEIETSAGLKWERKADRDQEAGGPREEE